jgi:hypothetical protein
MKNWKDRELDFEFLLDSGLLFEINRSTLHLIGIALTVKKNNQGRVTLGLKDCRQEPEKLVFGKDTLAAGKEKLSRFMAEFGRAQDNRRTDRLGWGCQW